jgi:putative endonuclease
MLQCSDNTYYIGHTDNLENRVEQHHLKVYSSCYTATRLPVKLIFSQEFATREEALTSERQIKRWSRKKKEALIKNDWNMVSIQAKRRKKFEKETLRDGPKSAPPQGERFEIFKD